MAQSIFSLSWEAHRNNICNGLSLLQQNEEFVDMTIAADGHFVKVHQMVMALASPYFKDLISSAAGRHPVIFLNKTSHTTLGAILEYIYTGKVMISLDSLSDLIQAAKELHIKGLEDMKLQNSLSNSLDQIESQDESQDEPVEKREHSEMEDDICYFEVADHDETLSQKSYSTVQLDDGNFPDSKSHKSIIDGSETEDIDVDIPEDNLKSTRPYSVTAETCGGRVLTDPSTIQYTVSNQGSIQMILNRYMYYLKHSNQNQSRQWRCVDYLNKSKCPAIVITKNNIVKQRIAAHIHAHHDQRILKKVRVGAIYLAIQDAELEGNQVKDKVKHDKIQRNLDAKLQSKSVLEAVDIE